MVSIIVRFVGLSVYRTREFEKLSDYRILDKELNISNQWILDSQKTNGCPALCCPGIVIISYMPYRKAFV